MNLSFKFWSNQFTSKFSQFQQNSPTVFLDVYRIFLSLVSKEEPAKNWPWVFSPRLDLNEAGGVALNIPLVSFSSTSSMTLSSFLVGRFPPSTDAQEPPGGSLCGSLMVPCNLSEMPDARQGCRLLLCTLLLALHTF